MYEDEILEDELLEGEYYDEEAERMERERLAEMIETLSKSVVKKRSDAVNGRKNSGIEQEWQEDEDFYQGIDDANRDALAKPISHTGGAIGGRKTSSTRSTVFLNITRPYVDMAAARIADILLPTDDRNWSISPTPIPELLDAVKDPTPVVDQAGNPVMFQPPMTDLPANAGAGAQNVKGVGDLPKEQQVQPPAAVPEPRPMTVADVATQKLEAARKKSDGAQTQIEDWLVECQYHAEVRRAIEDAARIGTGVLKGPFPKKMTFRRAVASAAGIDLQVEERLNPASKRVDPWNFYPDPDCGDNIQNGAFCFEKDYMTARQLVQLKGQPGYIDEKVEQVIEEGPGKAKESGARTKPDEERYEVWYYHGFLDKEELESLGCSCEDAKAQAEKIPAILTLVNDCIIKAALSPIESGEFPYDVMPWQRRQDNWAGIGVARQVNISQRMLNASTRNLMDNAGLSAGPQIVLRKGVVTPADNSWEIRPRKIWYVNEDADSQAVNQAFMAIQIPAMTQELMGIIQFALQMAEQTTGMPMILQGQQNEKAPAVAETVGGMTMMMSAASTVLRRLARTFDDCITEPHIRRYYEFLMLYGENDEIKGDYVIDARGSTALVERDIQNQAIMQMGQYVMNPAFGVNPKKWFAEVMKIPRLDPAKFQFTDAELQQMQMAAQQQGQQAPAPAVLAAQIRAEVEKYKVDKNAELQAFKVEKDTDRDTAYVQAQANRDEIQAMGKREELMLKRELAMLEYANTQKVTLDQIKADLAETAMKLRTQKELAAIGARARQMDKPPVEPPGKAPAGQSFQK